jgi:hypothetical protein
MKQRFEPSAEALVKSGITQIGRWRLSFEKLYDLIAIDLLKAKSLADLRDFNPDLRHIARDKRARQSPCRISFQLLNLTRMGNGPVLWLFLIFLIVS